MADFHEDDAIDRLLRADARASISDAGFSRRVLGALPSRSRYRAHLILVPAAALVGSILAALLLPGDLSIAQGVIDLVERHRLTPAAMGQLALAAVLLISAIVFASETD